MARPPTLAASAFLALALLAGAASAQDPLLPLVVGMRAQDAATRVTEFTDVAWYSQDLSPLDPAHFPTLNRVVHQHPLPAAPAGQAFPADTEVTLIVATEVIVPNFSYHTVDAARVRAVELGVTLAFYTGFNAPIPIANPELVLGTTNVVSNHATTGARTRIQVGGTVGLVIVQAPGDPPFSTACLLVAAVALVAGAGAGYGVSRMRARG